MLKKAEEFTSLNGFRYEKRLLQRVCVYIALANYYKKRSKLQAALQASLKAARLNEKLKPDDQIVMSSFTLALLQGHLNLSGDALKTYERCLTLLETKMAEAKEEKKHVIFKAVALHNMAIEASKLRLSSQTQTYLNLATAAINVPFIESDHSMIMRILETKETLYREFGSSISLEHDQARIVPKPLQQAEVQPPISKPSRPNTPSRQTDGVVPSPRAIRRIVSSPSGNEKDHSFREPNASEANNEREGSFDNSFITSKKNETRSMIRAEALRYRERKNAVIEMQVRYQGSCHRV